MRSWLDLPGGRSAHNSMTKIPPGSQQQVLQMRAVFRAFGLQMESSVAQSDKYIYRLRQTRTHTNGGWGTPSGAARQKTHRVRAIRGASKQAVIIRGELDT